MRPGRSDWWTQGLPCTARGCREVWAGGVQSPGLALGWGQWCSTQWAPSSSFLPPSFFLADGLRQAGRQGEGGTGRGFPCFRAPSFWKSSGDGAKQAGWSPGGPLSTPEAPYSPGSWPFPLSGTRTPCCAPGLPLGVRGQEGLGPASPPVPPPGPCCSAGLREGGLLGGAAWRPLPCCKTPIPWGSQA